MQNGHKKVQLVMLRTKLINYNNNWLHIGFVLEYKTHNDFNL